MKRKIQALLIVFMFQLAGCAVSGPEFVEHNVIQNEAILYVYRTYSFVGSGQQPVLRINNLKISKILAGGYTVIRLAPGEHNIQLHQAAVLSSEEKEPYFSKRIKVNPGDVLYFKWRANLEGVYGPTAVLITPEYGFVPSSVGEKEIRETALVENEQKQVIESLYDRSGRTCVSY